MSVLVTGFQPFGADSINSSWEVARALDGVRMGNARVVARIPDNAVHLPIDRLFHPADQADGRRAASGTGRRYRLRRPSLNLLSCPLPYAAFFPEISPCL